MDVVSYPGTVARRVVAAEHGNFFANANGNLSDIRHEVVGDALRVLADQSAWVRARGVEVSQQSDAPSGRIGSHEVPQDPLDHQFRMAVGVGGSEWRVFTNRHGRGAAVHRSRGGEHEHPDSRLRHRAAKRQCALNVVVVGTCLTVVHVELEAENGFGLADLADDVEPAARPAVRRSVALTVVVVVVLRHVAGVRADLVDEPCDRHLRGGRLRDGRRSQDPEDGHEGDCEYQQSPHHCLLKESELQQRTAVPPKGRQPQQKQTADDVCVIRDNRRERQAKTSKNYI